MSGTPFELSRVELTFASSMNERQTCLVHVNVSESYLEIAKYIECKNKYNLYLF